MTLTPNKAERSDNSFNSFNYPKISFNYKKKTSLITNNMVKAWKEKVTIPTYEVGAPEKNPIFLEKRVYQGSSGVVYPYPVIESISNEKTDKEYNAVFIENEYIKVMILP